MKKTNSYDPLSTIDQSALLRLLPRGVAPSLRTLYEDVARESFERTFGIEREVVMLDLETTGLNPVRDEITEIALIKMQGPHIVDEFSSLVRATNPIPSVVADITGITDDLLAQAPAFEEIAPQVSAFVGDATLVAHNAQFDSAFMKRVMPELMNTWVDSLWMARVGLPSLTTFRQDRLASWLYPEVGKNAHRAGADTQVLARVWRAALCGMAHLDYSTLEAIRGLAPTGSGGEHDWIAQVLGSRNDQPESRFKLQDLRRRMVAQAPHEQPLRDAYEESLRFERDERKLFDLIRPQDATTPATTPAATPAAAPTIYPHYEERPSQQEMAASVYSAFRRGQFLSAEAPTGVGKSLAYLLPAALTALDNEVGVGIATATNTLTDHLLNFELPQLNALLGGKLRYAAVKGYENYLCLRKIEQLMRDLPDYLELPHLLAWVSQTDDGDIAGLSGFSRRDGKAIATQHECLRRRCRFYPNQCYLHGARKRAQSAHIVVTNHALVFRDALSPKPILPPLRYWVIDEAHNVERGARDQLSLVIRPAAVRTTLRNFFSRHGGLAQRLDKLVEQDAGTQGEKTENALTLVALTQKAEKVNNLFDTFLSQVADLVLAASAPTSRPNDELWVGPQTRDLAPWGMLTATGRTLYRRLEDVTKKADALYKGLNLNPEFKSADALADLNGFLYEMGAVQTALGVWIDEPEENLVYSVSSFMAPAPRRRDGSAGKEMLAVDRLRIMALTAAPLEVGSILLDRLYSRVNSLVYTSATMAVVDSFGHFDTAVGLDLVEPTRLAHELYPSGYDLPAHMRIFVASDIPDPRSHDYQEKLSTFMEAIHRATGGGVLSLFTNKRDLDALNKSLRGPLSQSGLELLAQSDGISPAVVGRHFVDNRHASLMALKSFWEGFDAPGDTLRCVFVPKLPFAAPGTPLANERNVREGSAAWSRHDLPEAIIELRQAIGRLIRSSTDEGIVILADSRLVSKGYGKRFLRALPVEAEIMTAQEIVASLKNS